MKKRITVIKEDEKGRNIIFRDNLSGTDLSREQLVSIGPGHFDTKKANKKY